MSPREEVIGLLQSAVSNVGRARQSAIAANQLAAEIPVFMELAAIEKQLAEAMQKVAKLRGL